MRVPLSFADVVAARHRIAPLLTPTPLRPSHALSARLGEPVLLKLETTLPSRAFKLRGAANKLLSHPEPERARGVVAYSTGNHGRAVAFVAKALGIRCVVCLSELVPASKVVAVEALGAEADVGGDNQDAAMRRAHARAAEEGLILVDPFDDEMVVAGQGTVGIEIVEALPSVATIIVPVSGGGLAAGVALAAGGMGSAARIIGVSRDRCPAMKRSIEAGAPIEVPEHPSLADSLGGGIGLQNRVTFPLVRDLVNEIRLVSDDEVATAMRFAFRHEHLVLEGAAATPIAVLLAASPHEFKGPVVLVATGDNVDTDLFLRIISPHATAR
jgi:threonine dehydratase